MKIDEFVRKANHNSEIGADDNDGVISICADTGDLLIDVPVDATNFLEVNWYNVKPVNYFSKHTREYLSALIDEFLETPINERFPEKKYRLIAMRYVEGPVAIKQYVTSLQSSGDYVTFDFGSKEKAEKWTDEELRNLSQWFPQEAIDAMKELVEED